MKIILDPKGLRSRLTPLLDEPVFRIGIRNLADDPFFVAHFLVSVSQGEGLGEAAVGSIGQEELAALLVDLKRQEREERGHKERTLDAAQDLFPEIFEAGRYRYDAALDGRSYYVKVLEANRSRLKQLGRYSRLNLYLTTTFGYEVMVVLLYRTVADAVAASQLDAQIRERVTAVLESILAEEETHLGVLDEHNALLAAARSGLSAEACEMLDALQQLLPADYEAPAHDSVAQVLAMMRRYADPGRRRAEIEAAAAVA